jgi:demethylspheroidene O-methyltransferase
MPRAPWRDQWTAWRNGLLANPRFQTWAADFPFTRPIARQRAKGLFDLVAGFVYSQTLDACVRLGLFDILRAGPRTTASLTESLNLPLSAAERLLGAAAALDLVERAGEGRYALGPQGAALLGAGGLLEMIEHHQRLYADLSDTVGLLRGESGRRALADYWPYATSDAPSATRAQQVSAYSALMSASLPPLAADIFSAYPLRGHRLLMDVGGGQGTFLAAAGTHAPALRLRLFDLPAVAARARENLGRAGLLERSEIVGGDFLSDPLPTGADLITLIRILHDHDDAGVLTLLKSVRVALSPEGALLIAEPMSAEGGGDRVADVYFAFYLLAMGRGRARTQAELFDMLRAAGFGRMRRLRTRTPFLMRAILARP